MNVRLIQLKKENKEQFKEMITEWEKYNLENKGKVNSSPAAIFKDHSNFDEYIKELSLKEEKDGLVPFSTYFLLDLDENKLVGATNIRYYLNDYLFNYGGHIGDGIRPSCRNKGYGKQLIKLSLIKCKQLTIKKVLMVANKNNIASIKTIVNNGGIFENQVINNDEILNRYWIEL